MTVHFHNCVLRTRASRQRAIKAAVMAVCCAWLLFWLSLGGFAQGVAQAGSRQVETTEPGFGFRVNSDLVLVNVSVRDKRGNLIRDMKQSDFTVLEDGKPKQVRSFDIEDVERFAQSGPAQVEAQGAPQPAPQAANLFTGSDTRPASIRNASCSRPTSLYTVSSIWRANSWK